MEPIHERLKALHRSLGMRRPSVFACRPAASASANSFTAAARPPLETIQSLLRSHSGPGTHAQILGQFSDAIGFVQTACTALEADEKGTFAVACLRFGVDLLNRAYGELDRAVLANVDTLNETSGRTDASEGARQGQVRRRAADRGHKSTSRSRKRGSVKADEND